MLNYINSHLVGFLVCRLPASVLRSCERCAGVSDCSSMIHTCNVLKSPCELFYAVTL